MDLLQSIWLATFASATAALALLLGLIGQRAARGDRAGDVAQARLAVLAALTTQTLDVAKFRADLEFAARLKILSQLVLEVAAIVQGPPREVFFSRLRSAGALELLAKACRSHHPVHRAHAHVALLEIYGATQWRQDSTTPDSGADFALSFDGECILHRLSA